MAGATSFRETPGWAIRAREASRDALEAFEPENPEPETREPASPEPKNDKLARFELEAPKLAGPEPETLKLASPEAETPKLATHEPATSTLERSEPESSHAAVPSASERPPISLAALKAAGIHFRPEEAVAIGQALCRALMTAQLLHRLEPDVHTAGVSSPISAATVFIHATNRVAVTVADPRDVPAAIESVGRVLWEILPANIRMILDTPILAKALASPPQFATLEELSQALAAYEELDGAELIQAVYERGEKLVPPPVVPQTPIATDPAPTLSPPDPRHVSTLRSGYHPATVVGAAIVAAITVTGLAGWFLLGRSDAEASAAAALLQARPIAPPTGPNFLALMPAVLPEKARQAASPNPVMASASRPSVARIERRAVFAPSPSVAGADRPLMSGPTEVTRSRADGPKAIDRAAREPAKNAPARLNAVSGPFPRTPDTPLATYSAKDTDVTPPIPMLPRLLAALEPSSPGVRLDALTIAVVVNGDGTAYSVRAVNEPENMGEYVLLTAALAVVKSWQFRPAMRDGVPVPYQLIVPLRAVTRAAP